MHKPDSERQLRLGELIGHIDSQTEEEQLEGVFKVLIGLSLEDQFRLMLYLTKKTIPVTEMKLFAKWAGHYHDMKL